MATPQPRDRKRDDERDEAGRPRRTDVEQQNVGDGTDSGGDGYREQQYPGMGFGELHPAPHAERSTDEDDR